MVTLAIQAGGQSRRMGRDKGLVELGGRALAQHVLDALRGLADDVVITTNDPDAYASLGVRMAGDAEPGAGALHGLATALEAAHGDRVLVIACDMPFVVPALAAHLLDLLADHDAAVPRRGGEFEPLLAAYRRTCLPAIRLAIDSGQRRVISFFPSIRLRPVDDEELAALDPSARSFFNVNTPEDLRQAERWLADIPPGD
jgi:molybdopterin-guanine dinucleotide biosynthesis protein A